MAIETSKRDPNYVTTLMGVDLSTGLLPTKVYVDETTHRLLVNAVISGGGASDGSIVDGVNGTIKATVVSYANSNPLTVRLTDTNGDYVGAGAGTQYTDGGVPPTHPVGSTIEWSDGANWQTVSTAKPLPVTATFSPSGTQDVNITKVAGSSISQGHGTAATAIRVELPTDGTGTVGLIAGTAEIGNVKNSGTFVVQATLAAETTKAIGVVRNADGAGNLLTSNSTTYTAKFGLDSNLLGTLGTAFSTAGKVDVKAADGDVFVRQATASNLNATVIGTGTFVVQATLAAETTKVIGTVNQGTSPWVTSNATTSVVGNGTAAAAQRVTLANDSTGIIATVGAVTAITNALPVGANVIGKVSIDQTTPGTTNKVDIADSLNNPISAFPAAFLRVTDEPHQVFYDPFDSTLDVTNRWTSTQGSSGVAASNAAGVMSLGTGTTANGYSKLTSQPSFTLPIPAWLGVSDAITIPDLAAPTANAYRFWGIGTTPGTPSTTTPVTDGVGFELSTAGKMFAVVYGGGTRTAVQDLSTSGNSTQPTDANQHRYIVYVRTDKAYWYIDGITSAQLVATSNFQAPQVQTLPKLFLAVGSSTPPGSNSQIMSNGATAWDTGKNAVQMADGTFPWRKAAISSAGSISVQTTADVPGTGATNLGKAEDAAHTSGDTGVMSLGVANEALTNISGTDADYTPIGTDRNGTVHVAQKASTATLSNVAGSATSTTLLAANAARIGAQITNDSSALLYIKFGTTASTTSYTVVLAGAASAPFSYYEVPAGYTGRIDAIWASAAGNARITEITP